MSVGNGLTVTVDTAVPVHVPDVPVTVYEVVLLGEAVTEEPVDALNPAVHAYEVAPEAVKVAVAPGQMLGELTIGVIVEVLLIVNVPVVVKPE